MKILKRSTKVVRRALAGVPPWVFAVLALAIAGGVALVLFGGPLPDPHLVVKLLMTAIPRPVPRGEQRRDDDTPTIREKAPCRARAPRSPRVTGRARRRPGT